MRRTGPAGSVQSQVRGGVSTATNAASCPRRGPEQLIRRPTKQRPREAPGGSRCGWQACWRAGRCGDQSGPGGAGQRGHQDDSALGLQEDDVREGASRRTLSRKLCRGIGQSELAYFEQRTVHEPAASRSRPTRRRPETVTRQGRSHRPPGIGPAPASGCSPLRFSEISPPRPPAEVRRASVHQHRDPSHGTSTMRPPQPARALGVSTEVAHTGPFTGTEPLSGFPASEHMER